MTDEEIEQRITGLIAAAPPLSDAQRAKLAELLRPVRIAAAEVAA